MISVESGYAKETDLGCWALESLLDILIKVGSRLLRLRIRIEVMRG